MNDLVTAILTAAVEEPETWSERKKRLLAEGKLISFEPEGPVLSWDELDELYKGRRYGRQ